VGESILERERELAELAVAAREAQAGRGSIVLIEGEAGIGKSVLVNAIRSVLPAEGRLLLGWCDDLATPRVLGPLRDLREHVGKGLAAALDAGDRGRVGEELRAELDWPGHATVLVVEDVHWADEATLDVLRYLVRRVESLPAVLVLTYRDEIGTDHPLRPLLGLASRATRVRRLRPARLSLEAVRQLGSVVPVDAERVYDLTAGNPFLVTEVLASGDLGRVPPSITAAAGARLSTLDDHSRLAVEVLSVVPSAVERWLVDAVVPGGLSALGPAEERGVLTVSPTRVAFRHELTRRAVVDTLPAVRRLACHQAVLAALLAQREARRVDLSRIMHHAGEVGDEATIVQYGPPAQHEAIAAGSHREAVAHGNLMLRYRHAFAAADLAEILERHAVECYTTGLGDPKTFMTEAVALRRTLGEPAALGVALRWLSRFSWWSGDRAAAHEYAAEAIEVLTGAGDDRALARALSNQSQLYAVAGRRDEAIEVGERAAAMARTLSDPGLLSHALNNVGLALWDKGEPRGQDLLEEALRIARQAGEVEHAYRAAVNMAWHLINDLRLDQARTVLDDTIDLCEESESDGFLRQLYMTRSMVMLRRGLWAEAERDAAWGRDANLTIRSPALAITALVRVRRGDDGGDELAAKAVTLAERLGEAHRLAPAATALLEAAWLSGSPAALAAAAERVRPWYDEIHYYGWVEMEAEVAFWMGLAGHALPVRETDHPYAHLAAGRWRQAAAAWERAGCPYEHALALSHSPEPADLLAALSILDGIGALPLARIVRERLRDLGVARVPRGPVASTRDNPMGLTGRQVEVLRLLAAGMTNAEIAAELVLSVRTVDTHVAAILDKLGVSSRRAAVERASALGLLTTGSTGSSPRTGRGGRTGSAS
jgi:DNA-binding CsgD family transcriptional regulator/tetratricopeptide (TPR) repeat protein